MVPAGGPVRQRLLQRDPGPDLHRGTGRRRAALCRADLCLEGVILEGENGWQYHSTAEFRQRLEEFLASPETHEALKRRAAESAEQFSAQRFAQRVERIYQMQLARRAASCVQGVTA